MAFIFAASSGLAQQSRDQYRDAYRLWREADSVLESAAAAGLPSLAREATNLATLAAKYEAARRAYLDARARELGPKILRLENAAPASDLPMPPAKAEQDLVAASLTLLKTSSSTIGNDPDPGLQPLRVALERERAALAAAGMAVDQRQTDIDQERDASKILDDRRLKALDGYRALVAGLDQAARQTDGETAAWAQYYQKLSGVATRGGAAVLPPATRTVNPGSSSPPPVVNANPPAARGPNPAAATPNPLPRPPVVTTLTVGRYTGAWFYPSVTGQYQGVRPETVRLIVRERDGHATGTLSVRFRLAAPVTMDPELRMEFAGDFKPGRVQTFTLITAEGARGTLELVPGSAINLLEVNFQTEARPRKIEHGNFILLRE
jgi:hypothetical protein